MLKEHDLSSPGAHRERKRVGRGIAAGGGKTAGRGTKGQKARTGGAIARYFQGGQNPIHKQLPYKRGFKNLFRVEYNVVNLAQLEDFDAGSTVTIALYFERRLARKKRWPIKILGEGELTRALTVQAHKFSRTARERIEAAGGQAIVLEVATGAAATDDAADDTDATDA
jgi:large subunit ribosomal protein L15